VIEILIVSFGAAIIMAVILMIWGKGYLTIGSYTASFQFSIFNEILNTLKAGGVEVIDNFLVVGTILIILFSGAAYIFFLFQLLEVEMGLLEYLTIGLAGGFVPIMILIFPYLIGEALFGENIMVGGVIAGLFSIAILVWFLSYMRSHSNTSLSTTLIVLIIFGLIILVRLAFAKSTLFPLYSDSAKHYVNIQALATLSDPNSQANVLNHIIYYYHQGFHLIATAVTIISRAKLQNVILILGQIILAVAALPVFFFVVKETKSENAGFFAMLLAAFGWSMPAYASNWGKYPAITSLISIQFVLGAAYILLLAKPVKNLRFKLGFLTVAILASTVIHSRSLIVITLAFVCWFIADKWQLFKKPIQLLLLLGVLVSIFIVARKIFYDPLLTSTFDPYIRDGSLITLIIILLLPFAIIEFLKFSVFNLLFLLSFLLCLFIPFFYTPTYGYQTLLDRPYAEITLYFPLVLLGGAGFAAILKIISRPDVSRGIPFKLISIPTTILLLGMVLGNAFSSYSFTASDCCILVYDDDINAFSWIDQNIPTSATILIPALEGKIFTTDLSTTFTETDGGVWVSVLTHRTTSKLNFTTNFALSSVLAELCDNHIKYIYAGSSRQSFSKEKLAGVPLWYQRVFTLPAVQIYQVVGCP
jgi:hypothetical protein